MQPVAAYWGVARTVVTGSGLISRVQMSGGAGSLQALVGNEGIARYYSGRPWLEKGTEILAYNAPHQWDFTKWQTVTHQGRTDACRVGV